MQILMYIAYIAVFRRFSSCLNFAHYVIFKFTHHYYQITTAKIATASATKYNTALPEKRAFCSEVIQ